MGLMTFRLKYLFCLVLVMGVALMCIWNWPGLDESWRIGLLVFTVFLMSVFQAWFLMNLTPIGRTEVPPDLLNLRKQCEDATVLLLKAWSQAADELGFDRPTRFECEIDGVHLNVGIRLKQFGWENGVLIFPLEDDHCIDQKLTTFACLNDICFYGVAPPLWYYEREKMIDSLNLFEWIGPNEPQWHNYIEYYGNEYPSPNG